LILAVAAPGAHAQATAVEPEQIWIAYAHRRPGVAMGIVNFVGGWHGDTCQNDFNRYVYRRAGAAVTAPTLWLYAENDRYYSPRSIKAYAAEFEGAGGRVALRLYPPQGPDGHYLTRYPRIWRADLESFLDGLGLSARP
jgi:dienelactone hydrolase